MGIKKDQRKLEAKLLARVKDVYGEAAKDLDKKFNKYMQDFARKDAAKRKLVNAGLMSKQEYADWRKGQVLIGERWREMRDVLTEDLTNADKIATSIISGYMPEAYALGHNYGTFQIEKGSLINTSYTLYSRETVERLIKDQPRLLNVTKWELNAPKDKRWNQQHITQQITQGILQGEDIKQVSKRLQNVTGMDERAALRNARTALTGAQNGGRVDAYTRAVEMGIKAEKQWLATMDSHTRDSHIDLDGEHVPVDGVFSNGLSYPGEAGGDPKEVYNCRCTLVPYLLEADHSKDNETRWRNTDDLGDMSWEEWKATHAGRREASAPVPVAETKKEQPKSFADIISGIKDRMAQNNISIPTTDDIYEAGTALANEANKVFDNSKELEELNKAIKEMEQSGDTNNPLYEELFNKRLNLMYNDPYKKQGEYVDWLTSKLAEVREMGADGLNLKAHLENSRSSVRQSIEYAYSNYPRSWVESSIARGTMRPIKTSRGYYSDVFGEIAISGRSSESQRETAFHELGHRFEKSVPGLLSIEKEFYERRTAGESLEWLGRGYAKSEKTRFDDFIDAYMGKDYKGTAYELVSMGFEYAYTNPMKLAKDKDMQAWIYGILALV